MDVVTSLARTRIAVGVAGAVAPGAAYRLLMLDSKARGPDLFVRLFALRDLALGVLALTASGGERTNVVRVAMAVDASDVLAALLATRSGAIRPAAGAGIAASALASAATAAVALRRGSA